MTISYYFSLVSRLLSWLLFLQGNKTLAKGEFKPFLAHLENVYRTRGLVGGIAYQKAVRTAVMNYLSGNPLRPSGVRCTTKGIPTCLGPLGYRLEGQDFQFLQILTSVLFSSRALSTEASFKPEPIIDPLNKSSSIWEPRFTRDF